MERDIAILDHILRYIDEIDRAVNMFGKDESIFLNDPVYRNAVSMPLMQIGELAKHLSNAFIADHPELPWKQIQGMRNWFAHQYMDMDIEVIWATLVENVPDVKRFCMNILTNAEE